MIIPLQFFGDAASPEVVLDREPIDYTGLVRPAVVICLAAVGVARRKAIFGTLAEDAVVIKEKSLILPETSARVIEIDFTELAVKPGEWALAALAILAAEDIIITGDMLAAGMSHRYRGKMLDEANAMVARSWQVNLIAASYALFRTVVRSSG